MITALDAIDLARTRLLFIENVGNLVCPASWDLGEDAKIVVFSVTEGEDKPVKYPKTVRAGALRGAQQDRPAAARAVRRRSGAGVRTQVNPDLEFLFTSALAPDGMTRVVRIPAAQRVRQGDGSR